jgi:hypothetical protein
MGTTTLSPSPLDLAKDARTLAIHAASVGIDIEMGDIRVYTGAQMAETIKMLLDSMSDEQDSLIELRVSWSHKTKSGNVYTPSLTLVAV